jgi:hypothetical protein
LLRLQLSGRAYLLRAMADKLPERLAVLLRVSKDTSRCARMLKLLECLLSVVI